MRGKGEGHITKVTLRSGETAWRGWITVGYRRNAAGTLTPVRRSVQRKTRRAVQEGLERLRAKYKGAALDYGAETTVTLHALLDKWLAHYIATRASKKRTPNTYRWAAERAKAFGDPLAAKVSKAELQEWIIGLDIARSSASIVRTVLHMAFAYAVDTLQVRTDNPAEGLSLAREAEEPERRTVSPEEGRALLRALEAERLGLAVALTYVCAMRPGEAAALRVADVDAERGVLTVRASHNYIPDLRRVEREPPKSKRGVRSLPVPAAVLPWVRRRLALVDVERAAMDGRWSAPDEGLLFVRESDGGRLDSNDLNVVARRASERAGLGNVGPRILRRSMLSSLAAAGVDAKTRAAIGGHTAEMTEAHYREVAPAEVVAAMGRAGEMLED